MVWSPDSQYITVLYSSQPLAEVYSIHDLKRVCGITEDGGDIVRYQERATLWKMAYGHFVLLQIEIEWCPDSKSLITIVEFGLFANVWTVSAEPHICARLVGPTGRSKGSIQFSEDKSMLAVLTKSQGEDYVVIYSSQGSLDDHIQDNDEDDPPNAPWGIISSFKPCIQKPSSLCWSPDCNRIVVVNDFIKFGFSIHYLDGSVVNDVRVSFCG